jgi:hypothetical protein
VYNIFRERERDEQIKPVYVLTFIKGNDFSFGSVKGQKGVEFHAIPCQMNSPLLIPQIRSQFDLNSTGL